LGQKVLQKRQENGKVYLKVHFDVIENIAKIQPILQGE
jgi:similar to stage IV sporulation protein